MDAVHIAGRQFPARTRVWPEAEGWAACSPDGVITVVDRGLRDVAQFRAPDDAVGLHGIAPDRTCAVISARSRVVVVNAVGRERWAFTHPAWGRGDSEAGSCWFSDDGQFVWAHIPREEGPDEWVVLDASTGHIVARAALQCFSAGSHPVRHPDGRHVGLSVGEGQDGSETYWGALEEGRLSVARLADRTRVLVDTSPDGLSYLTTPHGTGPVQVHRFPDGAVVSELDPEDVLDTNDAWDLFAGFLDSSRVILTSTERDSLLVALLPNLDRWAEVAMPRSRAGKALLVDHGHCLTHGWMDGLVDVWQLRDTDRAAYQSSPSL